jgi:hypothetical protein
MAAISLVGALTFYWKWQKGDGPIQMALAAILLAAIAYWRHRMLVRKRSAFRHAVRTYEKMLGDPVA